ncbi:HotDog domain-containing protein [Hypomontagnella monticulosa]|nr:HotDog domain-containing protein [Hypomontagnella monticulosa]
MSAASLATNPPMAATKHNQSVPDPLAHFKAIPWCAALLTDKAILDTVVPDRRPLPSGESSFVRKTMNSADTVRACVTFIRMVRPMRAKPSTNNNSKPGQGDKEKKALSGSEALLSGGGKENGEDMRNPFLLFNALADLGTDLQSFVGTMHGGLFGVLMDEVMGTAANMQAANGAYTVKFTTNFRRAVQTPQVVLIRGRVVRKDGRKLYVKGTIEDKDGNVMAEGDGLWLAMDRNVGRSKL